MVLIMLNLKSITLVTFKLDKDCTQIFAPFSVKELVKLYPKVTLFRDEQNQQWKARDCNENVPTLMLQLDLFEYVY